jgi:hypothetical protein
VSASNGSNARGEAAFIAPARGQFGTQKKFTSASPTCFSWVQAVPHRTSASYGPLGLTHVHPFMPLQVGTKGTSTPEISTSVSSGLAGGSVERDDRS